MRAKLTFSNVVSMLALFVALGGTGYAAAKIGADDIKNDAVRGRHVKNGTLHGADMGPESLGGRVIVERTLGKVPKAATADNGIRAYAHVQQDATLDASRSKNVLEVRPRCKLPCSPLPPPGPSPWQCYKLPFTPNGAVGSTALDATSRTLRTQIPVQEPTVDENGCPPGFQAETFTFNTTTGNSDLAEFYVVFY